MRVTPDMIDKQLRFKGKIMSRLVRYNSPKNFQINNKILEKLYKGKDSKKMICEEQYVTKKDGGVICRPGKSFRFPKCSCGKKQNNDTDISSEK